MKGAKDDGDGKDAFQLQDVELITTRVVKIMQVKSYSKNINLRLLQCQRFFYDCEVQKYFDKPVCK